MEMMAIKGNMLDGGEASVFTGKSVTRGVDFASRSRCSDSGVIFGTWQSWAICHKAVALLKIIFLLATPLAFSGCAQIYAFAVYGPFSQSHSISGDGKGNLVYSPQVVYRIDADRAFVLLADYGGACTGPVYYWERHGHVREFTYLSDENPFFSGELAIDSTIVAAISKSRRDLTVMGSDDFQSGIDGAQLVNDVGGRVDSVRVRNDVIYVGTGDHYRAYGRDYFQPYGGNSINRTQSWIVNSADVPLVRSPSGDTRFHCDPNNKPLAWPKKYDRKSPPQKLFDAL